MNVKIMTERAVFGFPDATVTVYFSFECDSCKSQLHVSGRLTTLGTLSSGIAYVCHECSKSFNPQTPLENLLIDYVEVKAEYTKHG